ncbi:MAG: septum formation initiator family protein [Clostridia bacterium]|nr:septum formation initiator family protein [Clostridia bacterium]
MTRKKTKAGSKLNTSLILAVAAFAIVCYFFISFFNLRTQISEKQAQVDLLRQQVKMQLDTNEKLEQQLDSENFDAFVEQRARDENFGYVYPDERVYYDMAAGQ